ncbi:MAG TPA: helix-turn-helix transcriptional regulator [Pseudomonas sp.]|jgi:transcriptional regulator with XRE-family HTH domain|uniref:helix-turn-helix domain-containing protein n=1 Tax=Pseudomonas sp. TaxID=306 RepID=UPI002EDB46FC
MNIGQRLKHERKRLGFTQAQFAALGGVAPNAQVNYERGERQPRADYLAGLASSGVDVLYIVTGVIMPAAPLVDKEAELISCMRALQPREWKAISILTETLGARVSELRTKIAI